ncbi:MAG: fluoride efflux transporter CrcB [Hyphomicrobiales bacterium]|nr:fluoride efflux transporter CrcB [Hyphomicrobiales bacterium]
MILVFIGAGIGGALRQGTNVAWMRLAGPNATFPFATFTCNVLGSFVMGLLIAFFAFRSTSAWAPETKLFMTTGILGGYTTFSTFSLDTAFLIERHQMPMALFYVLASVIISILALFTGLALVRALT